MFQPISNITAYHFGVQVSQVIWLAQMSLPITCLTLLPIAYLSEVFNMRILLLSFNALLIIGSIIKIAVGRIYFEWLMCGQAIQLVTRVAFYAYGSKIANIWCKKNEISRGTAVIVAGMVFGMGLGFYIPPFLTTNQLNIQLQNSSVSNVE